MKKNKSKYKKNKKKRIKNQKINTEIIIIVNLINLISICKQKLIKKLIKCNKIITKILFCWNKGKKSLLKNKKELKTNKKKCKKNLKYKQKKEVFKSKTNMQKNMSKLKLSQKRNMQLWKKN